MTRYISDELPDDAFTIPDSPAVGALIDGDPECFLAALPQLDADELALLQEDAVEIVEAITPTKMKAGRKPKNYINNADLMIEVGKSRAQDQMTNELVKMLTTLCDRYGTKGSFGGYSYLDDMKAYAMYMIVRTWRAFNPEKGSNPFAFYTQCIKNSFIQYLNKERTERDIRDQLLLDNGLNPSYTFSDSDNDGFASSGYDD